jgi:hypothetical protein
VNLYFEEEMVEPLKEIISEEEFLNIFQKQTIELLKICVYLTAKEEKDFLYTKRFYGNITTQSRILEDFLDDYGAKNNRNWIFFRELTASARYMGFSAYMIQHLRNRYALYDLKSGEEKAFLDQTIETQNFFNTAIKNVFRCIGDEARRLGLPTPAEKLREEDFLDVASNKMLPHNVNEDFSRKEEEIVVKIASEYLNIMQDHEDFRIDREYTGEEITPLIPEYISEEKLRKFQLRIHNLQSVYDTYIKDTKIEMENATLNSMRGSIAVALHLAEIATTLSHFYERHESELRHEEVREKIEIIIDKSHILKCIVNYCLFHCYNHLEKGNSLARSFLKSYVVMDSIMVPIPIYMGFHVRPATLVMKIVKHYGSEVKMHLDNETYDAGSALDIFRANEKISATKRRLILKEIKPCAPSGEVPGHEVKFVVLEELNRLMKEGKLISYEELRENDVFCETEEKSVRIEEVTTCVAKEIKRLMAAGKIDIRIDVYATFTGDQRALKDIETLARAHYGEDEKGNNIELPPEIDYLRK